MDYTHELKEHSEDRVTDADGVVVFDRRELRVCLISEVTDPIATWWRGGAHASYGPDAYLVVGSDPKRMSMSISAPKGSDKDLTTRCDIGGKCKHIGSSN